MLRDLPDKPRESWSLREAIHLLKDTIYGALDRGYSYEEVADLLSDRGIKISPSSLKSYLASSRKVAGESNGRKRGRRRKSVELESGELDSGEEAEAPVRQRRPRGTAARTKATGATPVVAQPAEPEPEPVAAAAPEPVSSTRRGRRKATAQ